MNTKTKKMLQIVLFIIIVIVALFVGYYIGAGTLSIAGGVERGTGLFGSVG